MGFQWPIKGPITQAFGRPALAVEPTMYLEKDEHGWRRCRPTSFPNGVKYQDVHPGIDIQCPVGTPVLAPDDGKVLAKVTYRVYNPLTNRYVYGLYAQFRFFKSDKRQMILHVDHLSFAKAVGTEVKKGEMWAKTGNSGISTGPHAHEELRIGPADDHWSENWSWFRWNVERLKDGIPDS